MSVIGKFQEFPKFSKPDGMFEEIEIKKFFELSSKIPSGQFIVLVVYRFYEMITISMSFTSKIVNSH